MKIHSINLIILLLLTVNKLYPQPKNFSISSPPEKIEKLCPVFIDIQLNHSTTNPFSPDTVKVDAIITNPAKKKIIQPGFFQYQKDENSFWQVRLTPVETGQYNYQIFIQTPDDSITSKTFSLEVITSKRNGFIRLNPNSNYTFQFESGKPFRGIGENVCWTDNYEYYFKKLNKNGCNFTRIWMCPWNLYLEWKEPGLGKYHPGNAARLDSVLNLAEKYNIYIMLCFDYHGVIQKDQGYFKENKWDENPYNAKNGGPCKTACDFFSNELAKKYYKNRLRYIIARYSYHSHILSWEFWNEVDLTAGKPDDVISWHREMADYIKKIDSYDHLITSSFSGKGYPDLWKIQNIDFSQTHHYNNPNFSISLPKTISYYSQKNNKPHVIGEYGSDFRGPDETKENDPDNIAIHNGLWAGLFSETPILPLTWWWDNIVDPGDLYFHLKAITTFSKDMIDSSGNIEKIEIPQKSIKYNIQDNSKPSNDLTIYPMKEWSKNSVSKFQINNTGIIESRNDIPAFLFGEEKSDIRMPPNFEIDYKYDGRFTIHINHVSNTGRLRIFLDDKLTLDKPLPLGSGKGEWEKSEFKEEWGIYQGLYNKEYGIDVPAGKHTIRVQNDGIDWIEIVKYHFANCGFQASKDLQLMGLQKNNNIYLWIRNGGFSWKNVKYNGYPVPIKNASIDIPLEKTGQYTVEWWDVYQGKIFEKDVIEIQNNKVLKLKIPELQKDIACKILYNLKF